MNAQTKNPETNKAQTSKAHTKEPGNYQDTPVDVKLRISALWIAMMFVFAYVDIFGLMQADFLEGLLAGEIIDTPFKVTQGFLLFAVVYILPASLMVPLSLFLRAKINRRVNLVMAPLYALTIVAGCIGEDAIFYLVGSAVEVVLLAIIARLAYRWPTEGSAPTTVLS